MKIPVVAHKIGTYRDLVLFDAPEELVHFEPRQKHEWYGFQEGEQRNDVSASGMKEWHRGDGNVPVVDRMVIHQ